MVWWTLKELSGSIEDGAYNLRETLRSRPPRVQGSILRQEKTTVPQRPTVPQTDTGGRAENAQAYGSIVLKELGKLAPQSR